MKTRITANDYRVWRNFLDCLCEERDLLLSEPLGEWKLMPISDWVSQWDWFIDKNTRQLYHHKNNSSWVEHRNRVHTHYSYEINYRVCALVPSGDLLRASVSHLHDRILIRNTAPRLNIVTEEDTFIIFDEVILKNPKLDWFHSYISSSNKTTAHRSIESYCFGQCTCC